VRVRCPVSHSLPAQSRPFGIVPSEGHLDSILTELAEKCSFCETGAAGAGRAVGIQGVYKTNGRAIIATMKKGDLTRQAILEAGLKMASSVGLEAVTIGELAKATGMSKSGLFAHFQSKENLQMEILAFAGQVFADQVVVPALEQPAGVARIEALVDNWIAWTERLTGGCIFVAASNEFNDRPGPVRDLLLKLQAEWLDSLTRMARSAIRVGAFRSDVDPEQFAFDLYSLMLGFHLYDKLLQDTQTRRRQQAALARLLATYRSPADTLDAPTSS